jgi:hypothetical protein
MGRAPSRLIISAQPTPINRISPASTVTITPGRPTSRVSRDQAAPVNQRGRSGQLSHSERLSQLGRTGAGRRTGAAGRPTGPRDAGSHSSVRGRCEGIHDVLVGSSSSTPTAVADCSARPSDAVAASDRAASRPTSARAASTPTSARSTSATGRSGGGAACSPRTSSAQCAKIALIGPASLKPRRAANMSTPTVTLPARVRSPLYRQSHCLSPQTPLSTTSTA